MKPNKTLVLLCDYYPLTAGEFFLDDELQVISAQFYKIYVIVQKQEKQDLNRFIPENLEILTYNNEILFRDKIIVIPNLFSKLFITEFKNAITIYKVKPSWILLKILVMDIIKSNFIIKKIKYFIEKHSIDTNQAVFYAYWHDYKALALARLNKRNKFLKTIARAHNSDLFVDRQTINYLPYKIYISKYLTKTISISQKGKQYFERFYKTTDFDKIIVSRLGKFNSRIPILKKSTETYTICSCSHFNDMKRVHFIVLILSELKDLNIKWVHFGWGPKENFVKQKITEHYPDLNYVFAGQVSNKTILDYYAENHIDLFLNVSESEGIPVSIMEALSAGIPVVATDVGGTREAVPEEVGFLLKKDFDVKYAANLIRQYLNLTKQAQETYRKNAFSFWHENFNAEKNYSAFAQLLQNL